MLVVTADSNAGKNQCFISKHFMKIIIHSYFVSQTLLSEALRVACHGSSAHFCLGKVM